MRAVRAVQTFAAGRRVIAEGQEVPGDDPVVRGRERLFVPVDTLEQEPPAEDDGTGQAPEEQAAAEETRPTRGSRRRGSG